MVESIEIIDNVNCYIQTEYGDLYPIDNVFQFKELEFKKYKYNNPVDFKVLQTHHSHSRMNARISASVPNTKHLSYETLNFSRLKSAKLVVDKQLDQVKFRVKYYNLKAILEREDGSKDECLVFTS